MDLSRINQSEWGSYARSVRDSGSTAARDLLGPGKSPKRVDSLVRRVHRELDSAIDDACLRLPEGTRIDCRPGCSYCCALRVAVSPPEVFTIRRRLAETTDSAGNALAKNIMMLAPVATRVDVGEWCSRNEPCPLLNNSLCSIYSTRPISCRGCATSDVTKCADVTGDPTNLVPHLMPHTLGMIFMLEGLKTGLGEVGLHGASIELISALALAITDTSTERRWLRGDDVFGDLEKLL